MHLWGCQTYMQCLNIDLYKKQNYATDIDKKYAPIFPSTEK